MKGLFRNVWANVWEVNKESWRSLDLATVEALTTCFSLNKKTILNCSLFVLNFMVDDITMVDAHVEKEKEVMW